MQTVEIDRKLLDDMLATMGYLHKIVSRMWQSLNPHVGSGKWLTPYAAANALGITTRALQTLKQTGQIGYFQEEGNNCLFKESDIAEYMGDNRMEADGCP
ncbi:MAG: helix-turn-helix domain-containing protein [Muribaculaceae bacterium]|nr:helix-turn-helix domain-containing protein [Muribaculaceae bacterium]